MRQSALPMNGLPPQVLLADRHYLGPSNRAKFTYEDEFGVMVFAAPAARFLPKDWLELVRWCLNHQPVIPNEWHVAWNNAGSQQWKAAKKWLSERTDASTVVSYSDPSVGHTGALYRACNWLWAPTWHRLKPPPTGNGRWSVNVAQSVKDRWVAILTPDPRRESVLSVKDAGVMRELPWVQYREPKWKRGTPILETGGGNYKRFIKLQVGQHVVKGMR